MKIIELTQNQYKNYASIHKKRNIGQSIEYAMLDFNRDKKKVFLGLCDEFNNIYAATLILIHNLLVLKKLLLLMVS